MKKRRMVQLFLGFLLSYHFASAQMASDTNAFSTQIEQYKTNPEPPKTSERTILQMSPEEISTIYPEAIYWELERVPRKYGDAKGVEYYRKVKKVDYQKLAILMLQDKRGR